MVRKGAGPKWSRENMEVAVLVFWVLNAFVNIAFAVAVWSHGRDRRIVFVAHKTWVLATLLGGPLVAAAYWLIHASSLADRGER